MAEPIRTPRWESSEPDDDDRSGVVLLQRWVERPDGSFEFMERPPTLEEYLDPQLEDTLTQGILHNRVRGELWELLRRYFQTEDDTLVLEDVKILLGRGFPGPGPDVSVIREIPRKDLEADSFDVAKQGALPCLVIEVISPSDARVRRMDEVNKVDLYERARIPEYLLIDTPRRATGHRFRIKGYRLDAKDRYQTIEPDQDGRMLSETTQLRFGVSQDGQRIEIFDPTGARLLSPLEEATARKAAEAELSRLRAEIERLRKP